MMTISDPEGRILLLTLTRIMDYFSCSPLFFFNNLLEVPKYAKMQLHMMTSLKHNNDVT